MKRQVGQTAAANQPTAQKRGVVVCVLLKGGVMAGSTAALLLLLCAGLISAALLREEWMERAVSLICVFSGLCGGLYSVRRVSGRPLLVGLGVGGLLCILLLAAGGLAGGGISLSPEKLEHLCACLCGGGIAGIFGTPGRKKRKKAAARLRREG